MEISLRITIAQLLLRALIMVLLIKIMTELQKSHCVILIYKNAVIIQIINLKISFLKLECLDTPQKPLQ